MAKTPEQDQRRRRRGRLVRGLLVGGAALGIPALVNAVVAQRAKRLPAPRGPRAKRFLWRNHEVAFRRYGDEGPAVVLLHSIGPGHSGLEWQAVAERLQENYRLWVLDLPGWGDSPCPPGPLDSHLYLDLLLDFLNDAVGERCTLAAAGLSAAYAVQVSVDHPEAVSGLALVVPSGVDLHGEEPDLKDSIIHRLLRLPVVGTSALNVFTSRAGLSHHLGREVLAERKKLRDATLEEYYRASHQPGAKAPLAAYLAGYLNHDVSGIVDRLEPPVWIAWGRDARSPAVESADLWLRSLPEAELEVFGEAGLLPHFEQPEAFSARLDDFLGRSGR